MEAKCHLDERWGRGQVEGDGREERKEGRADGGEAVWLVGAGGSGV